MGLFFFIGQFHGFAFLILGSGCGYLADGYFALCSFGILHVGVHISSHGVVHFFLVGVELQDGFNIRLADSQLGNGVCIVVIHEFLGCLFDFFLLVLCDGHVIVLGMLF